MNDLLELKGELEHDKNRNSFGLSWPKNKQITCNEIDYYITNLERLKTFWQNNNIISGSLISVYYNRVIPKSSRLEKLFSENNASSNDNIRGVRFSNSENKKHIITYHISKETLSKSVKILRTVRSILSDKFNGFMDNVKFEIANKLNTLREEYNMSKTLFRYYIKELLDIEKFDLYQNDDPISNNNLFITFFNTGTKISEIMNKLGIGNTEYNLFSTDTIYVNDSAILEKIKQEASYLISMATTDLATYYPTTENSANEDDNIINIPDPKNEPTIGVIDTLFNEHVYFKKWVDYRDELDENIDRNSEDYEHGTAVTSIIVDGSNLNPKRDDGCGNFKVRHFGVAKIGVNSSFDIIRKIEQIVKENRDIHVRNISLGSIHEINQNFISPEAAALDKIQYENNVIFVVAGTNKNNDSVVRIGAPADSINSIVVNAVDKDKNKASYARKGKVLSFFLKPDVCAFGGDKNGYINVCTHTGHYYKSGTSFAAPWIARKLSYLIDKIGLSREIAKALIIDSAVGREKKYQDLEYLGYGVVPTEISKIIQSQNDEIKFYIEGIAESYITYTYNLPIPLVNDKFPFYAKAVLCYFPKCTRSQGVDYTNTELDIQFGRVNEDHIESINKNTQNSEPTYEKTAREMYRKRDNVKVIIDEIKEGRQPIPRKSYGKYWGLKITNKQRIDKLYGLKFGVLITLKEMFGENRIRKFIDSCMMRGWIVNRINVENRLEVYNIAEETIEFE